MPGDTTTAARQEKNKPPYSSYPMRHLNNSHSSSNEADSWSAKKHRASITQESTHEYRHFIHP